MDDIPVSQVYTDGSLSWHITANDAPVAVGNQLPGVETLNTTLHISGPGVEHAWGWAGPKLYPGTRVHHGYSECDGLPMFVLVQFDPTLKAVHVETTRRTITVAAAGLPVHFGLKFTALPLTAEEELISVYGDEDTGQPGWNPPVTLPPNATSGWLPAPD
ncbi:hypothetical protein [Nocardia suismassiliense]|uniref:hypothetical protein n=1 Tax=Nocardia suismassiliense TaxID=2077092 RepID=UPI00131F15A1|nr:hypothetical protein [Nocardia suismassiliense]